MAVRTRYLLLLGLRWLPVGLLIPVSVLLPLSRGLTLAQSGSLAAVQGIVVMVLELPTGGLTDALGRRPVLVAAGALGLASLGLLVVAHTAPMFLCYWILQGIYRALDSGPLEAWYVDASLDDDFETGLSRGGVVIGAAVAGGALLGGGVVALGPIGPMSALSGPVLIAFLLQAVSLACVVTLMHETRPARGRVALLPSVRGVPGAILGAARLVRGSRVVAALIGVELFWGFGMVAFESLMPVRLSGLLGSSDRASALMGPVGSGAWAVSAAGAALVPILTRRVGTHWAAFALRIAQGLTVAGMAAFAGPAGVIVAYLLCYAVHGAANPVHNGLLHRQVHGPNRAALISINSMAGQPAWGLGLVVLTSVAGSAGVPAAMLLGAFALAVAAPLYLVRAPSPGGRPGLPATLAGV
jgi:hypothetical protein